LNANRRPRAVREVRLRKGTQRRDLRARGVAVITVRIHCARCCGTPPSPNGRGANRPARSRASAPPSRSGTAPSARSTSFSLSVERPILSRPPDDPLRRYAPPGSPGDPSQLPVNAGPGHGAPSFPPPAGPSSSEWSKSASVPCSARPAQIWNRTRQPEWRSTPSGRFSGTSRPSQVCVDARTEFD
jgi:hypothetical protein